MATLAVPWRLGVELIGLVLLRVREGALPALAGVVVAQLHDHRRHADVDRQREVGQGRVDQVQSQVARGLGSRSKPKNALADSGSSRPDAR